MNRKNIEIIKAMANDTVVMVKKIDNNIADAWLRQGNSINDTNTFANVMDIITHKWNSLNKVQKKELAKLFTESL